MSTRRLKTLLWQSISAISPSPLKSNPFFSTNPSQPFPSPFKSSHQSLKLCFPRLLCTSWQDNLDGLFDPNYLFKPESSGVESISAEEFASLPDSVLDTSAGGKQIGYSHTAPVYNPLLELLECGNKRVADHFLQ
ncbi:uncharacterized protein LOC125468049 [Pyrus x bretschneideri]|uniref:uncharacterized protein LOC125468049 n=1 Tax=Pyrus x bretschneideri TaxID=225117 RepID=UPI00202E5EF3|nr:uncharacterized protein LOC125468049 [Pyrus x bretschneideri]